MRGFYIGVQPEAIMSAFGSLGLSFPTRQQAVHFAPQIFSEAQLVARILEFTGYTIDDVINDPIARNAVGGYYRLHRIIEQRCDELQQSRAYHRWPSRRANHGK
jgi:hypothetical protein